MRTGLGHRDVIAAHTRLSCPQDNRAHRRDGRLQLAHAQTQIIQRLSGFWGLGFLHWPGTFLDGSNERAEVGGICEDSRACRDYPRGAALKGQSTGAGLKPGGLDAEALSAGLLSAPVLELRAALSFSRPETRWRGRQDVT